MDKLCFGTGGIPISTAPRNTENGIKTIKQLDLGSMELEFVRNVNISAEKAPEVKKIAENVNVILTAHGSYFINLNAAEPEKRGASRARVVQAAKILDLCGGYSVCFHPAYRMGATASEAYTNVKEQMKKIMEEVYSLGLKVWIRPETAGKLSGFGTLDELIKISLEFEQVLPCIDFSHLRACSNGKLNSYYEYSTILETVERELGKRGLKEMHLHVQGVNYNDKGERNHISISEDKEWNYKDLVKALKDFSVSGVVICESPVLETDALILKKTYESL